MKILYHHRTLSRDGQSVHIDELVNALEELGHEVLVAGPRPHATAEFGSNGGLLSRLKKGLPRAVSELLELGYNIPAFLRLYRAYRTYRPDAIYERYNLFLLAGLWLRRLTGTPLLLEVNAPLAKERSEVDGLRLQSLAHWCESAVWRGADRALPVTAVLAEHLLRKNVAESRIQVIHNGVSAEFLREPPDPREARRALGIDAECVLGFVGFMRPWHGLDRVIDFLASPECPPNVHVLLVGDGPARPSLEAQARERNVSHRVTFAGLVPRDRIIDYLASFDVALQPDVVPYASPLKLFEYMALAKAIVAPATPNIEEVLTDRQNAVLFDPQDSRSFHKSLTTVCSDAALRKRMGSAARRTIVEGDFTWAGNARRVEQLMSELVPRPVSSIH